MFLREQFVNPTLVRINIWITIKAFMFTDKNFKICIPCFHILFSILLQ